MNKLQYIHTLYHLTLYDNKKVQTMDNYNMIESKNLNWVKDSRYNRISIAVAIYVTLSEEIEETAL
jgi:hypothetical protein